MSILSDLIDAHHVKMEELQEQDRIRQSTVGERYEKYQIELEKFKKLLIDNLNSLNWKYEEVVSPHIIILSKPSEISGKNHNLKFEIYEFHFGKHLAVKVWGTEVSQNYKLQLLTNLLIYNQDDPKRPQALTELFNNVMAYLRRNWLVPKKEGEK